MRIGKRFPEVNISQNLIGMGFKKETNKNYIFAYLLSKLSLLQIKKNKKKQLQDKLNLDDIRNIEVVELPEVKIKEISELVERRKKKQKNLFQYWNKPSVFFIRKYLLIFQK